MDHATRRRSFETGFEAGLFGCFGNCSNCLATLLCLPCIWGRIAQKVSFLKLKGVIWAVIILILLAGALVFYIMFSEQSFMSIDQDHDQFLAKNHDNEINTLQDITPNAELFHPKVQDNVTYTGVNYTYFYVASGLVLLVGILTGLLRTQVRKARNLSGNFIFDCLASTICLECVICQMSTETDIADDACAIFSCPDPEIV